MAKKNLNGLKVAILVDQGFDQIELIKPRKALDKVGAETKVVSPQEGEVRGWNIKRWGKSVAVDVPLETADPSNFEALLLPGGVMNPDKLRMNPKAVQFVKHFIESGKPVAAMSHGVWLLIDAGGVRGRKLTSWPSLQTDIRNAGGHWVDEEFVFDQGLLTSRQIENMRAFTKKLIDEFSERENKEQRVA